MRHPGTGYLMIVVALILLFVLTGCGSSSNDSNETSSSTDTSEANQDTGDSGKDKITLKIMFQKNEGKEDIFNNWMHEISSCTKRRIRTSTLKSLTTLAAISI